MIGRYTIERADGPSGRGYLYKLVSTDSQLVALFTTEVVAGYTAHALALADSLAPENLLGGEKSPLTFEEAKTALLAFCDAIR